MCVCVYVCVHIRVCVCVFISQGLIERLLRVVKSNLESGSPSLEFSVAVLYSLCDAADFGIRHCFLEFSVFSPRSFIFDGICCANQ